MMNPFTSSSSRLLMNTISTATPSKVENMSFLISQRIFVVTLICLAVIGMCYLAHMVAKRDLQIADDALVQQHKKDITTRVLRDKEGLSTDSIVKGGTIRNF